MKTQSFILAAFAAAPCFAQGPDATPTQLEPMVVTPTRSQQLGNTTASGLIVITREEIERGGASVVADVLRTRAGVEVLDTFGDGSRTLVGLRGFGENAHSNTLVLVDGRRLNNPDIGAPDLNSISLDRVERIEIVPGSAGALYGDQAVGGVINIVTIQARKTGASAHLTRGSYGRSGLRASGVYAPDSSWLLSLDAADLSSDNYRDHNEMRQTNQTGRAGYSWSEGSFFLEYQRNEEYLQTPGALFQAEMDANRRQSVADFQGDFTDTNTDAVRIGLQQRLADDWAVQCEASHRISDAVFRTSFRGFPVTSDQTQVRRITGFTPRLTGSFAGPGDEPIQLTLGSDVYLSDYRLNTIFGPQLNDQQAYDGYAQVTVPLAGSLGSTAALRYGSVENDLRDGGGFPVFPAGQQISDQQWAHGFGIFADLVPVLRVFTRYDHSYRFPKVDEFFGAGGPAPAVNLRTQTGNSFEAGAEWRQAALIASLMVYRLELDNEIVFDPTASFGFGANTNLPETRRDGQLLEVQYPGLNTLALSASYAHIEGDVRGGALDGKTIPLSAEHVGRLMLDWSPISGWSQFIETQANSKRFFSGDFDNSLRPLPGYTVVNIGTRFTRGGFSAKARVNNVLDKKYSEFGTSAFNPFPTEAPAFFPSPETNFWITLGYEF